MTATGLVSALLFILTPPASGLGLGVKVIPGSKESLVGGNNRLWFMVTSDSAESREILIINNSDEKARINVRLNDAVVRDGKFGALNSPSPHSDLLRISNKQVVLNARQSITLTLTTKFSSSAEFGQYVAALTINSEGMESVSETKKDGTYAVGKNALQYVVPVYLFVGDRNKYKVDFEIVDLLDYSQDGKKLVNVVFENLGNLPLGLSGSIQFTSQEFSELSYGPFNLGSEPISEGDSGIARILLPDDFEPGKYKVLIIARQANVEKTKVFEKNLQFPNERGNSTMWFLMLAIVILIALAVFYSLARRKLQDTSNQIIS